MDDLILFPLLRHAPQLERLKVDGIHEQYHARPAAALSTHCPKNKSLEIFHIEFTEQELFRLVDIFEKILSPSSRSSHQCQHYLERSGGKRSVRVLSAVGMSPEKKLVHLATAAGALPTPPIGAIMAARIRRTKNRSRSSKGNSTKKLRQIALLVLELSLKLKAQPQLREVRISWLSPCYQKSFATASAFANNELDQEYLHVNLVLLWL
ncbi:MAG: hypothetical protein J3R72DRAFT_494741 [Linnemannia gamsii]|nr:MAG: hypothetical protein J3R72DRAFT_494741 [Linnemannia gamsii]